MDEADARARIKAQATEEQRRAVADVLAGQLGLAGRARREGARRCGTSGSAVRAQHPNAGQPARRRQSWCRTTRRGQIRRSASSARLETACGHGHYASTTSARPPSRAWTPRTSSTSRSPSLRSTSPTNSLRRWPPPAIRGRSHITSDVPHSDDPALWHKRFHCVRGSGPADERSHPRRRMAQPAVRAAVRRLVERQSGVQQDYLAAKRAARWQRTATTPRPRNRGSSTRTAAPGSGRTRPAGGRSRQAAGGGAGAAAAAGVAAPGWQGRRFHRRYGVSSGAPHCMTP